MLKQFFKLCEKLCWKNSIKTTQSEVSMTAASLNWFCWKCCFLVELSGAWSPSGVIQYLNMEVPLCTTLIQVVVVVQLSRSQRHKADPETQVDSGVPYDSIQRLFGMNEGTKLYLRAVVFISVPKYFIQCLP